MQTSRSKPLADIIIDGPSFDLTARGQRLKRPMRFRVNLRLFVSGPFRAALQPSFHHRYLIASHRLALRRHSVRFIVTRYSLKQDTLERRISVQRWPRIPSTLHGGNRIEPQTSFLFDRTVASETLGLEQRLDLAQVFTGRIAGSNRVVRCGRSRPDNEATEGNEAKKGRDDQGEHRGHLVSAGDANRHRRVAIGWKATAQLLVRHSKMP